MKKEMAFQRLAGRIKAMTADDLIVRAHFSGGEMGGQQQGVIHLITSVADHKKNCLVHAWQNVEWPLHHGQRENVVVVTNEIKQFGYLADLFASWHEAGQRYWLNTRKVQIGWADQGAFQIQSRFDQSLALVQLASLYGRLVNRYNKVTGRYWRYTATGGSFLCRLEPFISDSCCRHQRTRQRLLANN